MNEELIDSDPKRVNKAISYACRVLAMREYSEKQLRQKIYDKGYDIAETEQTIQFLLENNWLSDRRFCESFVRSKVSRGIGLLRLRYELADKGISSEMLESVLAEQSICWQDACDNVTIKKVATNSFQNTIKDRLKLERFLKYRGFSGEQVRKSVDKFINQAGVKPGEHDE